jgi:hypothetical protein
MKVDTPAIASDRLFLVYMFVNSSKSRPNYDAKIQDKVQMIPEICHVHWLSNHAFTGECAGDYAHANG